MDKSLTRGGQPQYTGVGFELPLRFDISVRVGFGFESMIAAGVRAGIRVRIRLGLGLGLELSLGLALG